jgi:phytanoyl-CoA hydroxylase
MLKVKYLSNKESNFYLAEGYLVIPGIISGDNCRKLFDEVMNLMSVVGLKDSKLRQTTQYLKGGFLDKLINSTILKDLASQLLQGSGSVYMPFTAVKSGDGGGRFHFHQDNQYTQFDNPGLNFWFALTDMGTENGCLQIVPGSHKNGTYESDLSGDGDNHKKIKWEPENFLPIEMKAGDCVVFSRLTIHGSGPNLSGKPRVAYAVQFHRDDVRAKWEGHDWVLLKENPRWNVTPVDKIMLQEKLNLDGH